MKNFIFPCLVMVLLNSLSAQDDLLPSDYLSKEFHAGRRAALREKMPAKSVILVHAFPTRTFSNDVDYLYHQNPDLYYFTGYREPHSLLLIFKERQPGPDGASFDEILVVQKRNPVIEQWTGKRLGLEGARQKLGIPYAINGEDFKKLPINFASFDKVIFDRLPIDIPNSPRDSADLFDLVQQFKDKAAFPSDYSKEPKFDNKLYRE